MSEERTPVTLYSQVWGQGSKRVILLHGLFGMAKNLTAVAKALSAQYQVIAFDLRNHGRSPHAEAISIELMAEDVAAMLKSLPPMPTYVLGHSLGGKVAMLLALRYPNLVEKLVVADIAPVTYPAKHAAIFSALKALDLSGLNSRTEVDASLAESIDDTATRQFLLQNILMHDGKLQWRMNLDSLAKHYDQLRAGFESLDIAPCTLPCLFLAGSESDYIQAQHKASIDRFFTHWQLTEVADAGHWLHIQQAQVFNRLVMDFFNA